MLRCLLVTALLVPLAAGAQPTPPGFKPLKKPDVKFTPPKPQGGPPKPQGGPPAVPPQPCRPSDRTLDKCLQRIISESSQSKQLTKDVAQVRKDLEDAKKKVQSGASELSKLATGDMVQLATCLNASAKRKTGFIKVDLNDAVKNPEALARNVLAQAAGVQRKVMQEIRGTLPPPIDLRISSGPGGLTAQVAIKPSQFNIKKYLAAFNTALKKVAAHDDAAKCIAPFFEKRLAVLEREAPAALASLDRAFGELFEPIAAQAIAASLTFVVEKLGAALGDPDAVHVMKGTVAEALLDPRRVKDLAAKIGELDGALASNPQAVAAKASAASGALNAAWHPKAETLVLLAAPGVKAGAKLVSHKLVAWAAPYVYTYSMKVVGSVAVPVISIIAAEVCSLGDVFVTWGCSGIGKVVRAAWEATVTYNKPAVVKVAVALCDVAIGIAVDKAVDEISHHAVRQLGKAGVDQKGQAAMARLPDQGARLNKVIRDVMRNLTDGYVRDMVTNLDLYNKNVAVLADHTKRLSAKGGKP